MLIWNIPTGKKKNKKKTFSKLRAFPVAGQVAEQLVQDA